MKTQIWAHRGASGYAPENTMEAFEKAIEMGAEGFELDVQMTKDGELVVTHDEEISRVSDGCGRVVNLSLEELRRLDFSQPKPGFGRCRIPLLSEVLELARDRGIVVNCELKNSVCPYSGMEERVLALVERLGMNEQIWYSSFNHYSMLHLRQLNPGAKTGLLYGDSILYEPWYYGLRAGVQALHPDFHTLLLANVVPASHQNGLRIHTWTVNKPENMERMLEIGVDAIITNYPDLAVQARNQFVPEKPF